MYSRKSNLETSDNDLLKLAQGSTGCCGDTATQCKYHVEIAEEAITVITFKDKDGNDATASVTFTSGDAGDIAAAIDLALRNAGFITNQTPPHIQVFVSDGATPLVFIDIFSTVEIVSITSTGGTTSFTQMCEETVACEFKASITAEDGMNIVLTDAVTEETDNINGDFGTPATDEDAFVDELVDAFADVYQAEGIKKILANYNTATGKYDIRVWLYGRQQPTLDDEPMALCGCITDFIEA